MDRWLPDFNQIPAKVAGITTAAQFVAITIPASGRIKRRKPGALPQ